MNRLNLMKIMQCSILAMLLLCLVILPSTAQTTTNVSILDKTKDSITVVDKIGRTVTIDLPVKKIIATDYRQMDVLLALGARDMIIGVDKTFHERMPYFGLSDAPEVSVHSQEVNYEYVLKLNPDLVIIPSSQGATADDISSKLLGVPVLVLSLSEKQTIVPVTEMMGEILGKEEEANKLIKWISKYDNIVENRTKDLGPQDIPTFFYGSINGWGASKPNVADGCGGINIAADLPSGSDVSLEWILSKNPDYIFLDDMRSDISGYGFAEEDVKNSLDNITAEKGFSDLDAMKSNHVYLLHRDLISAPRWVAGHVCIAKWLHPDLFEDLSPEEIHKEYFKEFHGIEVDGTWAYPNP